jgi:hypothetical protein
VGLKFGTRVTCEGMIESDSIITDLAIERSGEILIFTSPSTAIFRVRPKTGKRRLLSDFTHAEQGVLAGFAISGMAVENSG